MQGPTRRQIAALMSWKLAAGLVGCSREIPRALADDLQKTADQQGLAILDLVAIDYGDRTVLSGNTIAGAPAGKVVLRGRPASIAVSPDGDRIAWATGALVRSRKALGPHPDYAGGSRHNLRVP